MEKHEYQPRPTWQHEIRTGRESPTHIVCWPASSIQQFDKRAVELARTTTVFISDCVIR
jgi:hypothetical protein